MLSALKRHIWPFVLDPACWNIRKESNFCYVYLSRNQCKKKTTISLIHHSYQGKCATSWILKNHGLFLQYYYTPVVYILCPREWPLSNIIRLCAKPNSEVIYNTKGPIIGHSLYIVSCCYDAVWQQLVFFIALADSFNECDITYKKSNSKMLFDLPLYSPWTGQTVGGTYWKNDDRQSVSTAGSFVHPLHVPTAFSFNPGNGFWETMAFTQRSGTSWHHLGSVTNILGYLKRYCVLIDSVNSSRRPNTASTYLGQELSLPEEIRHLFFRLLKPTLKYIST